MSAPECTCYVTYGPVLLDDGTESGTRMMRPTIVKCALCDSAEKMYDALALIQSAITYDSEEAARDGDYGLPATACRELAFALAAARGEKVPV